MKIYAEGATLYLIQDPIIAVELVAQSVNDTFEQVGDRLCRWRGIDSANSRLWVGSKLKGPGKTKGSDADADGLVLDIPTIDNVFDGDTEVTGTGTPGSTVHVKDEAGNLLGTGVVDAAGNFIVKLDAPLVAGMKLEVTQSQEDENGEMVESDPAYATVQGTGAGANGTGTVENNQGGNKANGEKLPNTATSTSNWLLAGLMTMLAGMTGLFTRRRKDKSAK